MGKEKKEIGKLIELLNEYKKIKGYDGNTKITNYDTDTGSFTNGYSGLEYEIVIGKRYGFIKWLVENDKIDNKKIADETYVKVNGEWYELILGCHYDLYQQTLMLLAIQDEPIRFLCEILK